MAQNLSDMTSKETGMSTEEVEDCVAKYIKKLEHVRYFDFIDLVETLPVKTKIKDKVIDRYLHNADIYTKYSDVDETLAELQKIGYRLGIFSEGSPRFQENKLNNLKITRYLDKELIFIVQSKRSEEYVKSLPPSIIVDDNVDICNMLVKFKQHCIIHLNIEKDKRTTSEKGTQVHGSIRSIDSLKELLDIL